MLRVLLLILTCCVTPSLAAGRADAATPARPQPAGVFALNAQPEPPTTAAPEGAAREAHEAAGEEAEHPESIWGPIARLVNFLVLVGVLYHFGRQPISDYLASRGTQIRTDLVKADEMKREAAAQIAQLERHMAALPAELETLKTRGQQDIAAEEARIEQAAVAERERLLEQTRNEIDHQLRVAHRELVDHASNLALALATERIKQTITPDDQSRLVDRYLQQVKR